jgi:acyl-CoA thioesterase FadM
VRIERRVRVHIGDDDSSGLMFFGTVFRYVSEGDQLLFERLGHPAWDQIRDGAAAPVVHASCDFLAPAKAGAELLQEIELRPGERSSMSFEHRFTAVADGTVVAMARTVRCWVDLAAMATQPLPSWLVAT